MKTLLVALLSCASMFLFGREPHIDSDHATLTISTLQENVHDTLFMTASLKNNTKENFLFMPNLNSNVKYWNNKWSIAVLYEDSITLILLPVFYTPLLSDLKKHYTYCKLQREQEYSTHFYLVFKDLFEAGKWIDPKRIPPNEQFGNYTIRVIYHDRYPKKNALNNVVKSNKLKVKYLATNSTNVPLPVD